MIEKSNIKMENKTNWWLIIAIVVIVAILTSLITLQVTGNTIKVKSAFIGGTEVYTKAEVDMMFEKMSKGYSAGLCSAGMKIGLDSSISEINLMYTTLKISGEFVSVDTAKFNINGVEKTLGEGETTIVDVWKITAWEVNEKSALIAINAC